jgi:ligand-binding sensor domain-containing protein
MGGIMNYNTQHVTQNIGLRLICILATAILMLAAPLAAQETISYPNGNFIMDMEIQGNYIWCATAGSLVRWNKADGTYRQFTEKEGLATCFVNCIGKDTQGNLWIGTEKGVQRFDGTVFTTYTTSNSGLVNDRVKAIDVTNTGIVWIGTESGLSRFDGKTWTSFTTQNSGIPSNYVNALAVDRNNVVWMAHYEYQKDMGASSFDGTTWQVYPPSTSLKGTLFYSIISITVDSHNVKWFGNPLKLVSFDGQNWNQYDIQYVIDMAEDSKGALWAAGGAMPTGVFQPLYSLSSFDGASWTRHYLETKLDYPIFAYTGVKSDTDGMLWFVTKETYGAFSLHSYDGTKVKTYRTDGPLGYYFSGIAVDKQNRKWFANQYGVACFDGKTWVNHLFSLTRSDINEGLDLENANLHINDINAIAIDRDDAVWASALGGNWVMSFDGKAWKLFSHVADEAFMPIFPYVILVDQNNIKWFVGAGVTSYDGNTWSTYKRFQVNLVSGAVDNDNLKWFGTLEDGAWSFDGTTWTHYNKDNSPLTGFEVKVAADKNNVKWFCTRESQMNCKGTIYRFDGSTWKTYGTDITGIPADYPIDELNCDHNGVLWITHRTLTSFDGKTWKTWPDIKTGSASSIVFDEDGYIWVASPYGSVSDAMYLSAQKLSTGPTAVADAAAVPKALELNGNYPNPFNPSTTLEFSMPAPGQVNLTVYDITGRKVKELVNVSMPAGSHSVVWDGRDANGKAVSSGVYLSRLVQDGRAVSRRMLLMK